MYYCLLDDYCDYCRCCSENGDEEAARRDLDAAAAFGSHLARMATTDDNPYAAICHVAVEEMMRQSIGEHAAKAEKPGSES